MGLDQVLDGIDELIEASKRSGSAVAAAPQTPQVAFTSRHQQPEAPPLQQSNEKVMIEEFHARSSFCCRRAEMIHLLRWTLELDLPMNTFHSE